jgi:NADPH:quinone reductase
VLRLTDGRGVDIVYNHIAGNSFVDDMKMLAPLGLIVSYAALGGMPQTDLFRGMRGEIGRSPAVRVIGTHVFEKLPHLRRAACEKVLALHAAGKIKPAVTTRLPLEQAAQAHRLMESRESLGKILLKP